MDEKLYYLGFSLFPGVGPVLFSLLLKKFKTAKIAWESPSEDLQKVLGPTMVEKFFAFRKTTNLEEEYEKIIQKDIQLVILPDNMYPTILKQLNSDMSFPRVKPGMTDRAPFLLYVKGNAEMLNAQKTIGIVGTRKMTPYGKEVTEMLTADLVMNTFVTVSGLALGVDACAHMATVKNGGKTIAVLGCGVDCCYPKENSYVYSQILDHDGTIISTFPPGMQASVGSFPARNAIIAGLSLGIVVTEGAAHSGSLITAHFAKKLGRPIFAVPGPITSSFSKGANSLLKDGAIAVTGVRDIITTLQTVIPDLIGDPRLDSRLRGNDKRKGNDKKKKGDTLEEQQIIDLLQTNRLHFDEIVRRIKKDSKTVGSLLSLLELKGIVKSNASMYSLESQKS